MLGRRKENPPDASTPPPTAAPVYDPHHPPVVHKRLGEVLLEEETITQSQLDEALKVQERDGGFLGQILVTLGFTTQEAVASCLVKQCKIPHLSLLDYEISREVLNIIPRDVCRKHSLIPIDKLGRILTVAMVDPLDLDALQAIRDICPELRIKPILCNWQHFEHVAKKLLRDVVTDGGPREISAASLGFGPQAAAKEKTVEAAPTDETALKNAVDHLIQQATSQAEAVEQHATPAVTTPPVGASPEQFAQMLQQGMRDAMGEMRDALHAVAQRPQEAAPPGISAQELAAALKDALREALQPVTPAAQVDVEHAAPAFDSEALAAVLRESLSSALQQSLAQMSAQSGATAQAQPALPSPDVFAEVIRDSVGGAMQEAMATLLVQLRSLTGRRDNDGQELANVLRQTVTEIQSAQEQRLAEIAQASRQSVEHLSALFEQAQVQQNTAGDLQKRKLTNHGSVSPFGPGNVESTEAHAAADAKLVDAMVSDHPIEAFTLDGFLPGKVNAFTFKLSQAVAQSPGGEYNPYFLYGEVGTGKTHLISAIGNGIIQSHQQARVGYVSASHFARRLSEATQTKGLDAFRENYCHWEVLILDDIQFLGGRVEAQEEFFHIFNVLRQEGRQIIIASDKAPDRLGLLEKRLVSRFASGIVAQLRAPEMETRLQILQHACANAGVKVPPEVLSIIAMRVPNDVRKMTGSLRKIVAYAKLVGQDMSCELAEEILSHLATEEAA